MQNNETMEMVMVKRFESYDGFVDDEEYGSFVYYSDYAALELDFKKMLNSYNLLESRNTQLRELLAEYMAAEHGERVCLAKGYKPELEALVNYLGWSEDYLSNQIVFEPPKH